MGLLTSKDVSGLKQLLSTGLDPNGQLAVTRFEDPKPQLEPLLIAACIWSDARCVEEILKSGARSDIRSTTGLLGGSPLAIASNRGDGEMATILVKYGCPRAGFSDLMLAVMRGDIEAAGRALSNGDDVDAVNELGRTALDYAHPNEICVKFLLDKGVTHKFSPLDIAVILGDESGVEGQKHLLQKSNQAESAVRLSILYDRPGILERILKDNPGIISKEFGGRTPLALSSELGRLACVRILLEAGADTNVLSDGIWPLSFIAERKGHNSCARLLRSFSKR